MKLLFAYLAVPIAIVYCQGPQEYTVYVTAPTTPDTKIDENTKVCQRCEMDSIVLDRYLKTPPNYDMVTGPECKTINILLECIQPEKRVVYRKQNNTKVFVGKEDNANLTLACNMEQKWYFVHHGVEFAEEKPVFTCE